MSETLWKDYAKIWQQTGEARKQNMLDCLAKDITYRDPQISAEGMADFSNYIDEFQYNYSDCGFVIKKVQQHNERSLAHWDCVNGHGDVLFDGTSFAVINASGKFAELNGFYPLPE